MPKAFITGSHAYGTPTDESDIDLVVLMDPDEAQKLIELVPLTVREMVQSNNDHDNMSSGFSLQFGNLNLLVCTTKEYYDAWVVGTKFLKAQSPVHREQAVALFKQLRENIREKRANG